MGWSLPYTLGVLGRWKMAAVYCQAVLCHGQRIGLDGAPAEAVDAEAKHLAAKQLVQLATRKVEKKAPEAAAPTVVEAEACPRISRVCGLRDKPDYHVHISPMR
jgi:sRNA-binding protein